MSATFVYRLLREPDVSNGIADGEWNGVIAAARAERLIGTLAFRLERVSLPDPVRRVMEDARAIAEEQRRAALWEAECARRALAPLGIVPVLLKGTAFAAAGLDAGRGRFIGDLDILVPRERLDEVEKALLEAGWGWVKPDPYDDAYYRRWMHELPPLIHKERDRMIDVHHTVLPLTARPKPDPQAMLADAVAAEGGYLVLSPEDMVCHAAAHLIADGELDGGLRNLWDIDRLCREYAAADLRFWERLAARAERHGLHDAVARALRLARALFLTPVPASLAGGADFSDRLFVRRMLARDGWGRPTRKPGRFGFYLRGHWLRMPPLMLARHLWIKWRKA